MAALSHPEGMHPTPIRLPQDHVPICVFKTGVVTKAALKWNPIELTNLILGSKYLGETVSVVLLLNAEIFLKSDVIVEDSLKSMPFFSSCDSSGHLLLTGKACVLVNYCEAGMNQQVKYCWCREVLMETVPPVCFYLYNCWISSASVCFFIPKHSIPNVSLACLRLSDTSVTSSTVQLHY